MGLEALTETSIEFDCGQPICGVASCAVEAICIIEWLQGAAEREPESTLRGQLEHLTGRVKDATEAGEDNRWESVTEDPLQLCQFSVPSLKEVQVPRPRRPRSS